MATVSEERRLTLADLMERFGPMPAHRIRTVPPPGLVRIPDVSFVSWDRLPDRKTPREPIPDLVSDLAVEILSESNTPQEMERKLRDYFRTGVRLAWYVEPREQRVRVYTSPEQVQLVEKNGVLDGGAVLPGFSLRLSEWFERADRSGS